MLIFLSMLESDEEREAFMELYNLYSNSMILVAQKIFSQNSSFVEDAVQNAWLKIVENFSKIMEISCNKRGAYLVITVRNEAISMIRKQKKELPLDEAIIGKETDMECNQQSIFELIHSMSPVYRAVLEMRFVEECSTREIANRLHLKESTVNTRIHRGRSLLIKKLKEEGYSI